MEKLDLSDKEQRVLREIEKHPDDGLSIQEVSDKTGLDSCEVQNIVINHLFHEKRLLVSNANFKFETVERRQTPV